MNSTLVFPPQHISRTLIHLYGQNFETSTKQQLSGGKKAAYLHDNMPWKLFLGQILQVHSEANKMK